MKLSKHDFDTLLEWDITRVMEFRAESLVTVFFTALILGFNTLILLVIVWTESIRNINKIYFASLTISDLCVGVFITPFAVFSSFSNSWIVNDEKFCHIEAYLLVIFFIAGLYSLAWINVDHYLAIRKPQRHKVAMTTTRSLCWIIFVWIGAVSFCSPTLFSFKKQAKYYEEVFLCTINAGSHKPYFVTAGILVILPAFFALVSTNAYLFTKSFRKKRHMYQTILIDTASRPNNYFMNFIISMIFLIAWIPWLVLQIYGEFIEKVSDYPHSVHFYLLWFGIGNSFYKFFVYLLWSRDFRRGLRQLCCHNDCKCSKCSMPQSVSLNFVTANAGK